jgi:DNA-binding NarL/FixJ family response regulator
MENMMGKTRIMLADNQTLFRSGLRSLLTGFDDLEVVGEAANGEEAVSLAARLKPEVLIMDIDMPGLSGLEAAMQIKAAAPECKILMLCAVNYDSHLLTALRAKVDGFLHKEVGTNELLSAIRSVKIGKHALDETTAFNILSDLVDDNSSKIIPLKQLNDREITLLKQAAMGATNREIAETLKLKDSTVQKSFSAMFRKLKVNSRTEAILLAIKEEWISLEDIK